MILETGLQFSYHPPEGSREKPFLHIRIFLVRLTPVKPPSRACDVFASAGIEPNLG